MITLSCNERVCTKGFVTISGTDLSIDQIILVSKYREKVCLSSSARNKIIQSFQTVQKVINEEKPVYGITTGFGKLSNVYIDKDESRQLQKNLIMSHACAVGRPLNEEIVRSVMLLRANTLAAGHSGVQPAIVETLISMLNKGVHPVVPEKGSLGASGDLANLAHIALVMIGLGEAFYNGRRIDGGTAMKEAGIPMVELKGKDGLGLINGTQIMTGLGSLYLHEAEILMKTANISAALTMEALNGLTNAMDPRIHKLRPHRGQVQCAQQILKLVEGSGYINKADRVQDAYSLRCIPQVHGASLDTINYVKSIFETEANSVTDNPIIFPDEEDIISGGNFHGQPLAIALDVLAIALSELANISERRIERLVNPQLSGLAPFLAKNSGINSGYMIAQYTAASLVSENKIFSHPASVDSIPSSANQEDHVSMGAIAARKAGWIIENLRYVIAIELMCAAQAIDLQPKNNMGRGTGQAYKMIRQIVPTMQSDRVTYLDIEKIVELLKSGQLVNSVMNALDEN